MEKLVSEDLNEINELLADVAQESSPEVLQKYLLNYRVQVRCAAAQRLAAQNTDIVAQQITRIALSETIPIAKGSMLYCLSTMQRPIAGRWLSAIVASQKDELILYFAIVRMTLRSLTPSWAVRTALRDDRLSVSFAAVQYFVKTGQSDSEVQSRIVELIEGIQSESGDWAMQGMGPGEFFLGREHVLGLLKFWQSGEQHD